MKRPTFTRRTLHGGCRVCHGTDAHWTGGNAQALAARHHDSTGHATWCDLALSIRYGNADADGAQLDIEDVIRGEPT